MSKLNVIGVDLAKNVIQVSVVSHSNRELQNKSLTRKKFAYFIFFHVCCVKDGPKVVVRGFQGTRIYHRAIGHDEM